jgi:hypothetical protein
LVGGAAALAAVGTMLGYRASFRRALRKARLAMDAMLIALQQQLDSQSLFGELPPPAPLLRSGTSDSDATMLTIIA